MFKRSDFLLALIIFASYLHLRGLFPSSDGISLKGELIFSDNSPAVFVPNICNHVYVRGPHLKLSLPIDDGGEGSTDQEGTFGVTL